MFVGYTTNDLAASARKITCVASLGEMVRKWRLASGFDNLPAFARHIGHGVTYQNLQQLESGKAKQPRYLHALAKAMGCTIDDLLALRMPPPLAAKGGAPQPKPAPAPARAPEPGSEGHAFLAHAHAVAAYMDRADDLTRDQVAPLLARLAQRPYDAGRTVEMLGRLLGVDERRKATVPVSNDRRGISLVHTSPPDAPAKVGRSIDDEVTKSRARTKNERHKN